MYFFLTFVVRYYLTDAQTFMYSGNTSHGKRPHLERLVCLQRFGVTSLESHFHLYCVLDVVCVDFKSIPHSSCIIKSIHNDFSLGSAKVEQPLPHWALAQQRINWDTPKQVLSVYNDPRNAGTISRTVLPFKQRLNFHESCTILLPECHPFEYSLVLESRLMMIHSSQTRIGEVDGQFLHARWWL